jgi:threonylcarbamoyladenosine tRNA methylthiotransferase CDKAL1
MPVADLEDIGNGASSQFERPSRGVRLRARRAAPGAARSDAASSDVPSVAADGAPMTPPLPGSQSVYVKTYGCSHNASDSEYICGLLAEYGYTLLPAARAAEADLWLINSCTVKNPSQDHLSTDLQRGRELRKRLVVAGCVPQADFSLVKPGGLLDGVSLLGVQQFDRVVEVRTSPGRFFLKHC